MAPRRSGHQAGDTTEDVAEDLPIGTGGWPLDANQGFFNSVTSAAILMRRGLRVSIFTERHIERLGITVRRQHMSQQAPAWRNNRNGLAVALEQDVRSAARCLFHDLI